MGDDDDNGTATSEALLRVLTGVNTNSTYVALGAVVGAALFGRTSVGERIMQAIAAQAANTAPADDPATNALRALTDAAGKLDGSDK